jgi:hypothetical protein
VAAVALLVSLPVVGATEPETRITSVHFEVGQPEQADGGLLSAQGTATPARYRSLVVEDRGIELGLEPLGGRVGVTVSQDHVAALAADLDGLRIGSAAPDFANSLAEAASSGDVHGFVRMAAPAGDQTVHLDVTYSRMLGRGDYLLVQDLGGDGVIELRALDSEGATLGTPITVGPTYQWNTGHGVGDSLAWASAVGVHRFGTGDQPVAVIRASGTDAEFKVIALAPATEASSQAPVGEASLEAPATEASSQAPVGEASSQAEVDNHQTEAQPEAAAVLTVDLSTDAGGEAESAKTAASAPATADAPPVLANVVPTEVAAADEAAAESAGPTEATIEPVTQLALTGMVTEPWVLVVFAMAFIFIGYTAYAAFRQPPISDESRGHDQLDALGFD